MYSINFIRITVSLIILILMLAGCISSREVQIRQDTGFIINLDRAPVVPEGIQYIQADYQTLQTAADVLTRIFSGELQVYTTDINAMFICGPILWSKLAKQSEFNNLGGTVMNIANMNMEQMLFMDNPDAGLELIHYINGLLKEDNQVILRRPIAEELKILWAVIPYPIEDPLFILENRDHKILIQFVEQQKIFYIDDYFGVSVN